MATNGTFCLVGLTAAGVLWWSPLLNLLMSKHYFIFSDLQIPICIQHSPTPGSLGCKVWASCQICKKCGLRMRRECRESFPPPSQVSNPDMHHGTCMTHVPWCMPGSLTSGFLWSRWRGKRSRHSRRMRNPQIYVSGKRPIGVYNLTK